MTPGRGVEPLTPMPIRCLLVSDFTIDALAPFLAVPADPPQVESLVAPFDQTRRVLLDGQSDCWRFDPEVAVVWTRPQTAIRSFGRLLRSEPAATESILAEVDEFAGVLRAASRRVSTIFVPTWTGPSQDRGLGLLNLDTKVGPAYHLLRMNSRLAEAVANEPGIRLLDAGRWIGLVGRNATSPKLWHLGKIAFGPEVLRHAAADIKAGLRTLRGLSRKLVVLDLDDTLWGGVVGDAGWENLNLGGHDPVGEAFCAFQQALEALTNRGIVLGIVSKNTEAVALEAIDRHPEMVLRRRHFAGWRINWDDKVENLLALVKELNLGLDSAVFIDDNPAERARVRDALPEILVPEWPADKLLYEQALAGLSCFDTAAISDEDRSRTSMYVAEGERSGLKKVAQSLQEYLASLGLRVTADSLSKVNLARATQLLNKTNQMNLSTRRMTDDQFLDWAETEGKSVHVFRVTDRFGDYGLTGIASLSLDGDTARVADFLLSCRVIGRGVEQAMLHALSEAGRSLGSRRLVATLLSTAKNAPCKRFFDEDSGFLQDGDSRYTWDLARPYPAPAHVQVVVARRAPES